MLWSILKTCGFFNENRNLGRRFQSRIPLFETRDYGKRGMNLSGFNIMIIDADADVCNEYGFNDSASECWIFKAKSLSEARANLHKVAWDLAIVDPCLPDGSGYSIMQELALKTEARIMAVTDRNSVADRVECFSHGAVTILSKPFIAAEFTAAVYALLRNVKRHSEYKIRDWNLDAATRQLRAPDGKSVHLSERDFAFMQKIMGAAGEPVTRQDLLAFLDSEGLIKDIRGLDMLVARLRRHIEENLAVPAPILTIQKVGFVFERRRRNS